MVLFEHGFDYLKILQKQTYFKACSPEAESTARLKCDSMLIENVFERGSF